MELVDSLKSDANLLKWELLAKFKKNLIKSFNLVLDDINESSIYKLNTFYSK